MPARSTVSSIRSSTSSTWRLVLKNATYVNVFSNELCHGDIAVAEGLIVGMGEYHGKVEVDVSGKLVLRPAIPVCGRPGVSVRVPVRVTGGGLQQPHPADG